MTNDQYTWMMIGAVGMLAIVTVAHLLSAIFGEDDKPKDRPSGCGEAE